ncbi:tripartite tricarboxylate transporter TctB family protein [Pseudothauera rhizosphaerae]|uniref:Tripartite tricarboxylate transporter TctB family protein n=1 Tax=Pseudothauera rhizosphaerae TaxID=2565932 RepID=A0A4S4AEJ3_9RHOO|nr:tripartite tricarboxylate transporter TctB family protein [Pseudothauera rhizosphaerae]THF57206.1 tripartite tricarboxylate transporter TctB family protein [Pseudothauera rhizosphaerae]
MINKILALFCIVLATAWYHGATRIPALASGGDPLGPRAFPMLLAAGLLGCAALLFFEARRQGSPAMERGDTDLRAVGVAIGLIALYFVLFERLGYLLSTMLFMAAGMLCCHANKRVALICALAFPLCSNLLFARLLKVPLPSGTLFS